MKTISCVLLACLASACASGPLVQTDHDPAVAFDRLHSYAWKQPPPISNPLLRQRVVAAIDAELAGKGWRQAPETEADVLLVGNVSARDEQTIEAFYDGPDWSGWGWNRVTGAGPGPRRVEVHSYKVGTLVLDMFDAHSRRAVWRAIAEGTVPESQARIDRDAMAAVRGMFAEFPPTPVSAAR
jgi:hypothetical protein